MGLAYYREPTRGFLEGLAANDPFTSAPLVSGNEHIRRGLQTLSASLEPFKQGVSDQDLERLQWDHFRMFIGSGMPQAPPWESVYRTKERSMFGPHTFEVRSFYERFGLVSERRDREPEDHIGLELEFMAYLSGRHGACLRRGDPEEAATSLQAQRDFLGDHLLPWAPQFCQDVSRSAESDFFVGVAYLTEGFLTWDDRFLREVS
jgi:TorA maturation chaperone TorD